MTNSISGDVYKGGVSMLDAVVIAGGSVVSRQIFGRLTGNNNLVSAGVKIGSALAINYMVKGKVGNYIAGSLLIDGAFDVANLLFNLLGVGIKNGTKKPSVI